MSTLTRPLSPLQQQVLGYLADNSPASVADVAGSLMVDNARARRAVDTLARRGLVDAQHTGHSRGSGAAFVTTDAGDVLAAELFGSESDSDDPIPLTLTENRDGTFTRRYTGPTFVPTGYGVPWDHLHPIEQQAVTQARETGQPATVEFVTARPRTGNA